MFEVVLDIILSYSLLTFIIAPVPLSQDPDVRQQEDCNAVLVPVETARDWRIVVRRRYDGLTVGGSDADNTTTTTGCTWPGAPDTQTGVTRPSKT